MLLPWLLSPVYLVRIGVLQSRKKARDLAFRCPLSFSSRDLLSANDASCYLPRYGWRPSAACLLSLSGMLLSKH
jgi:hypothetical protein